MFENLMALIKKKTSNCVLFLHSLSSTCQCLPLIVSLAVVRTPSAEKTIVPVSSSVRLDRVRPWTCPLVLTRHWLFGFTRMPSFCQIPSTSAWESSTSKEAVSLSKVSWSVRPLRMVILRAGLEEMRERSVVTVFYKYIHAQQCTCS